MTTAKRAAAVVTTAVAATETNIKKPRKVTKTSVVASTTTSTTTGTSSNGKSGTVTPTKESKTKTTMKTTKDNSLDISMASLPPNVANKIDRLLIEKAVTALLKHHTEVTEKNIAAKGKLPLLDSQNVVPIQVQFGLEVAPSQPKIKPIRIQIPHSIYQLSSSVESNEEQDSANNENSVDEAEICLIVKDDSTKAYVIEMKEQFPQYMKNISKVITLPSLRNKYSEYSQRRLLLSQYTHFIADDRILPMLTSSLGKDFIAAKKQPIPISMTRKSVLPHAIKNAILHATYLFIPDGTCITIRAGYTCQTVAQMVDNILSIMVHVPNKVPRQWANIKNINIKLPTSIALPIYNQTPSELIDIAQMAGVPSIWVNDADMKKVTKSGDATKPKSSKKTDPASSTNESTTVNTAHVDSINDKKKKSPLLKAIAKQKKDETMKIDSDAAFNENSLSNETKSKKKRKSQDVVTTTGICSSKVKDTTTNAQPNAKKPADEKVVASPSKKVKTSAVDTSSPVNNKIPAAKTKAKEDLDTTKQPKDKSTSTGHPKPFVAAKKFQGPKTGYVFHVGALGLGYYIDQPPKVMVRSTNNNNNKNNHRRSTISPHRSNTTKTTNNHKKQRRSR